MSTASTASIAMTPSVAVSDRWTRYNATVLTICILGWAFDIYEATIMQLVTPILIKEWGITPATMVTETAPPKWPATALGGLVGGYPFGYMLCSLAALVVVPLWGWRSLYFLGILPALLVLWIRIGIKESPRYERVTAQMLKDGLKKQ